MQISRILNNRNVAFVSFVILACGVLLSLVIGGIFDKMIVDADKDWVRALKFTEENAMEFPYAVKTEQGNLFASGEVKAVSPLLMNDNLPSQYLAIKENMEEYRMHTETYSCNCRTVNNQTSCDTCTRTYWSWDYVGSHTTVVERISLLGQEMNSSMIPWEGSLFDYKYESERLTDGDRYLSTGSSRRSYFDVIRPGMTGSFGFTSDQDGFRYSPNLNGPRSGSLKVGKTIAQIMAVIAGMVGAVAFWKYNYEENDIFA